MVQTVCIKDLDMSIYTHH